MLKPYPDLCSPVSLKSPRGSKLGKAMSNNTTYFHSTDSYIPCDSDDGKSNPEFYVNAISMGSSILMVLMTPVAVVGNTLILAALWKKTFHRTSFHILLSGLALTDFFTGLIAQPFEATGTLMHLANLTAGTDRSLPVVVIQAIGEASSTYFVSNTVFIITLISVERWLYMSRRSLVTSRYGHITVVVLLLAPIPLAFYRSIDTVNETFGLELNISIMAGMLICYLTTSLAYFNVFRIIRRHQQQVQANAPTQNWAQSAINVAKYKKSVVTMLYILAVFSFCFLPYIVYVGVHVQSDKKYGPHVEVIHTLSLMLLFLSSSLNPGLYLWRMNDIRGGVKQLIFSNN